MADTVEQVVAQLLGGAGLGGTDMVDLRNWLLQFGSESLCKEMALWTMWLANQLPPWATYWALMACQLVALNKQPGICPVGIGKIYQHLMAKCLLVATGHQAMATCDNLNLCAGLPAGIEGAVHTMGDAWTKAELQGGHTPRKQVNQSAEDSALTEDTTLSPYTTLLVNARNGFNELSCKAALWTVQHCWSRGSRFAFNCYCYTV